MRLRIPEKPISDDGFTDNDLLGRKGVADTILNLVRGIEHELIIGLDAKWGEGKSYFLKQLQAYAAHRSTKIIWFDAFQHDLSGDAFSAITGQLLSELDKLKQSKNLGKVRSKLVKTAAEVGKILAHGSMRAAGSYLTGGLLSPDQIKHIIGDANQANALAEGLAELVEESTGAALATMFDNYSKTEASLSALQATLKQVASELKRQDPETKIIFVIDELDRCRPDFSIEIIEVIKHFYKSDEISFLISADFRQLENSVRHCYGSNIDTERYLDKFYDIRIRFPKLTDHKNSALEAYSTYAQKHLIDDSRSGRYTQTLLPRVVELGDRLGISLRSFQKILLHINVALNQTDERTLRAPPVIIALCVTKVLFPDVYDRLSSGDGDYDELIKCFGLNSSDSHDSSYLARTMGCWQFCLLPDSRLSEDDENVRVWFNIETSYSVERLNVFPLVAKRFIDTFDVPTP